MGRRRRRTIIPSSKRAIEPRAYHSLWRVVDGAVADCINKHPEYLTDRGRRSLQASITKRVTGSVFGFAREAATSHAKRRSVSFETAATKGQAAVTAGSGDGGVYTATVDCGRVASLFARARGRFSGWLRAFLSRKATQQ